VEAALRRTSITTIAIECPPDADSGVPECDENRIRPGTVLRFRYECDGVSDADENESGSSHSNKHLGAAASGRGCRRRLTDKIIGTTLVTSLAFTTGLPITVCRFRVRGLAAGGCVVVF
jgi:hypothetical protein